MALSNDPVFPQTPKTAGVELLTATSTSDEDVSSTTNRLQLMAAGADGALVTSLKYFGDTTSVNITAQSVNLWLQPGGTGDMYLLDSKVQVAYTAATTTAQTPVVFVDKSDPDNAIRLAASDKLFISHSVDLIGHASCEYIDY